MAAKHSHKTLSGLIFISFLVGLVGCCEKFDLSHLEGAWDCTTLWTWDNDGVVELASYKQQSTCNDSKWSNTAVLSLGTARWSETTKGDCHASGQDLYGKRTLVKSTPLNDAARQFERDKLDGRTMASLMTEAPPSARILSLTEAEFIFIGHQNRITTCQRPGSAGEDK